MSQGDKPWKRPTPLHQWGYGEIIQLIEQWADPARRKISKY